MLAAYLQAAQAQPVPPKGGTAPTPQDRAAGMEQSLAKVLAALPEPLQARLQQWASAGKGLPQTATDPALPQATSAQVLPQAAAAETAVPQAGDWPLSWKQVAHKLLTQLPSDPTAGSPRTDKAAADPATALDQALRTLAAATPATHSTPAAPVPAPVLRLQGYPELQRLQQLLGQVQDALSAGNGLTAAAPATLSQAPASTAAAAQGAVPLNLPQPPGDGAWGQALGERVLWMVGQDVQHAQVRLNPPDLGPLEIRVALHNDQASVSFHAQHPFTREAIEAALPRLREMLGDANINLASVDVGQRETGGSRGRQARAGAANGRGVAPVEGVDVSAPPPTVRTAAGLVDDFA
jgi:flagellar hook-length control protein FliK